jgi:hypothetical protein
MLWGKMPWINPNLPSCDLRAQGLSCLTLIRIGANQKNN